MHQGCWRFGTAGGSGSFGGSFGVVMITGAVGSFGVPPPGRRSDGSSPPGGTNVPPVPPGVGGVRRASPPVRGGSVFTGVDAKDFLAVMTRLLGPMPTPPKDLAAVSTHTYAGADGKKISSVRFYGGTDRCDVGIEADMTPGILSLIVGKVGIRI